MASSWVSRSIARLETRLRSIENADVQLVSRTDDEVDQEELFARVSALVALLDQQPAFALALPDALQGPGAVELLALERDHGERLLDRHLLAAAEFTDCIVL